MTLESAGKKKSFKTKSFPFVAIGASAGGFEAVTQLLRYLPSNTGMSFIYVQHLSPDYKSMLASLLSKSTKMKVQEAKNGMYMAPDNFYVIPPDKEMSVTDGHIKLVPRRKEPLNNLPIDIFFSSLAEKHKEYVIGVLLSGSASDGTRGLKVIKEEGGLTFAQDASAKFSFMPESAITHGVVDFVLSPKEIAQALVRLSKRAYMRDGIMKTIKEDDIDSKKKTDLKNILQLLYKKGGIDFSHYKMNTIKRRIIRRMQLNKIKTLKQYTELLEKKKEEVDMLSQDLLINVTYFFRDSAAFQFLKTSLFPKLLKSKTSGETLRIWIPACSTGEEVYSIAMNLLEAQGSKTFNVPVQIFATDLSAKAIRKARIGEYTEEELKSLSPKLLQQYFVKVKDRYRVGKLLRDVCVFAQHNILSDPAFSHVDFISCCNLLIYLDATAQKKVIATFHYALKENGYLMLGKSETIGASTSLFSSMNKKHKIYQRKKNTGLGIIPSITPRFSQIILPEKTANNQSHHLPHATNGHLGSAVDSVLLSRYMPTSVVINHDMEILEFRGSTEFYLRHASGKASFNILKMARPEYAFELRNAIHNAIKTKKTVHKTGIEMKVNSSIRMVSLEVTPLKIEGEEPLLLVLFTEQQRVEVYEDQGKKDSSIKDRRLKKMEEELLAARADMLSITHDHEATIEELQSANEEVVSNNEELRTLNEELETSKEEIESTNEELLTANQKLQMRNEQVEELYNYSEAIISTIHNPMLVLDQDLYIKSANKPFCKQFHSNEEIMEGTKFFDLSDHQWKIPQIRKLLNEIILKKLHLNDIEVSHDFKKMGQKILLINARRVIQKSSNEQLILVVIEDVTEQANLHKKEQELIRKLQEANKALKSMNAELSSFSYVSSHDLQEPLRKIKTFASYVLKEEHHNLSPTGKDYFRRMQNSVNQMQTLVKDLLTYSRTNSEDRKFEQTDLTTILHEVVKDFGEVIKEKKAVIETGESCSLKVIRFQFRQLMYNLIGNALKFSSPERAPRIKINSKIIKGSKLNLPAANYCHISVSDDGIGFEPKYEEQVFEIFERLHDKETYTGTGIGLAICKKVVKNHNGIITATSKLNKGTTFDIYLPME